MKFGKSATRAIAAMSVLGLSWVAAEARELRVAAWNLEHLNDADGEGCVERTEADFDAIARRIESLGADVVAFQEVENAASAQRVFSPVRWNVVMSSRPDTGEGPTCYNRPEGRLQHQATGIAIRRSVAFRRDADLALLGGGNPYLRWGTHVVVGRGEAKLHVLSIHLKSGCWGARQDEQGREACAVLRSQMSELRSWIEERRRNRERFVIAGDFNRRLALPDDWAWQVLSPASSPLELATAGSRSMCDPRFPNFIDHIVLGGADGPIARGGSFREETRDGPHPDHCPISVAIADGPPGAADTRAALTAWSAAFVRTSADQTVGSIERRLARGPGSYATPGARALARENGIPHPEDLLSTGAFQLSPGDSNAGSRWRLWGAGEAGSMSSSEPDVRGRVRTATLGADIERGPATLGIALSHSRGRGSTLPTGPIEAELSTIAPYSRVEPREGMQLFGVVGKGEGTLRFEPAEGKAVRTDLETTLAAFGLRAKLGAALGVEWFTRARAALTAFETGPLADLAPIDSRAGRLWVGLDGSRRFDLADRAEMTPRVELGLVHDVGDHASGTALEFGAGLFFASADRRLELDGHAKGRIASGDERSWEIGGRLVLDPGARERGLSLSLAPTWGAGGMKESPGSIEAWNAGQGDGGVGHLRAEIAYGLALGARGGILAPFGAAEWASDDSPAMRVGARWRWTDALTARIEAVRDAPGEAGAGHSLLGGVDLRW